MKTLEQNYFSWKSWDQYDNLGLMFTDAKLKVDFAGYKKGEKFDYITIDYEYGYIEFVRNSKNKRFKIGLEIKEEIK